MSTGVPAGRWLRLGADWGDSRVVDSVVEVAGKGAYVAWIPGRGPRGRAGVEGARPPARPPSLLRPGAGAAPAGHSLTEGMA